MQRVFRHLLGGIGFLFVFAGCLQLAPANIAQAQSGENVLRIAAVVNDDIISILDLDQRLRLAALSSNLRLDAQTRQRLMPQVLRGLIDERLQMQEAESKGTSISDREIDNEMAALADRNKIPPLELASVLARQGVDIQTLRNQLRAQILWQKYTQRRLVREVDVGEEEIDEELDRLQSVAGKPQKRVFEIFLGVDNPDHDIEVRQNIDRLLGQIRSGADFSSVARSFSESSSASQGGDLGWLAPGQLPDDLDTVLANLAPGMVSAPIRSITGYYLLYVTDMQTLGSNPLDATVDLYQMTVRPPAGTDDAAREQIATELVQAKASFKTCDDIKAYADGRSDASIAALNDIRIGDMREPILSTILSLDSGQTSVPLNAGNNISLMMVCKRDAPTLKLPERDQIYRQLADRKLELVIRRKMRDLRREAFIDIRL